MKKFKKILKKMPQKCMTLLMIFAILLTYIAPLTNVIAASYGEGDKNIHVDLTNTLGFTVNSFTVNGNNWTGAADEFKTTDDIYHIEITVTGNTNTGDKVPALQHGGNWNEFITTDYSGKDGNVYTFVKEVNLSNLVGEPRENQSFLALEIVEKQEEPVQQQNPQPGNNPQPNNPQPNDPVEDPAPHFDGKAYVIWSCGNGTCYHYFDNIPNFDDGNSTFYKATDIKADNDNTKTFDVNAKYKAWALPDKFNSWQEAYKSQKNVTTINWANVNPEDIISENPPRMDEWEQKAVDANKADSTKGCQKPAEDASREDREAFETCVDNYYISAGNLPFIRLQPVGEPNYPNSYVSYGDRNFKVVIYNEEYKGVAMGDLSELNYYPSEWANAFIKRDQFDLSGTTKDKPALLNSILLEKTVVIKTLDYNSFEIKSIEALDVPKDAVEIKKEGDEFKLMFSSNFYDNVVFKVTDENGAESYMQIKRYTIDGWINFVNNKPVLQADFYFDRNNSYEDFDLTAKILYKDGTTKNVTLTPTKGIDDGLGNITDAYEVDEQDFGGKGLKKATFTYPLANGEDRQIQDVYLNAEFKGSTETNYAGAYVGSGEGTLANIYHGEEE